MIASLPHRSFSFFAPPGPPLVAPAKMCKSPWILVLRENLVIEELPEFVGPDIQTWEFRALPRRHD